MFKSLKSLSLQKKVLISFVGPLVICFALGSVLINESLHTSVEKQINLAVKNTVENAYAIIEQHYQFAKTGVMSETEAKERAKFLVSKMRFGEDFKDYYWISDVDSKMVMHPIKQELSGQDVSHIKDSNGLPIFVEMAKVAKKSGSGYIKYDWQYGKDKNHIEQKVSFIRMHPEWKWIVGSGTFLVYLRNISQSIFTKILSLILVSILISSLIAFLVIKLLVIKPSLFITKSLGQVSGSLSQASSELVNSSVKMNSANQQQSAATQQSVSSLSEMSAMIERTEEVSTRTKELVGTAKNETNRGQETIEGLENVMDEIINNSIRLKDMRSILANITEKTSIIHDIVFKTQLLSFNASIEAARAGEFGQGFAVVAEEIGNLAKTSGTAASEINKLLNESSKEMEVLIKHTEESSAHGADVSEQVKSVFNTIGQQVSQMEQEMDMILSASTEQKQGIQQANVAMLQLNESAMMNTEAASDTNSKATSLNGYSSSMKNELKSLNEIILGSAS
ncbi:MAG: hypothetical protein CL674_03945 [Bdellovibrionaceae bacterium]|nr:hypothetical protein [Pseudobdellovibrionaceae bacterium]|tara:strand:+ start:13923 stop:15446 length:1524 start_codon:yes stop_codon:yes gene_type:complete